MIDEHTVDATLRVYGQWPPTISTSQLPADFLGTQTVEKR